MTRNHKRADDQNVGLGTGLRRLAKIADENPELFGKYPKVDVYLHKVEEMLTAMDTLHIRPEEKTESGSMVWVKRKFGPLTLELTLFRGSDCAQVKVGTKKVVKKDPAAVEAAIAALPDIEVEEDIMKWKCLGNYDEESEG